MVALSEPNHSFMRQADRTQAFIQFSNAPSGILLCTDVAARGLDFPKVTHIIQFDPPGEASEYVHRYAHTSTGVYIPVKLNLALSNATRRVGRTARLGREGNSLLFVMPSEMGYIEVLKRGGVTMREWQYEQELRDLLGTKQKRGGKEKEVDEAQIALALLKRVERLLKQLPDVKALAKSAFQSFVRAYATHPKVRPAVHNAVALCPPYPPYAGPWIVLNANRRASSISSMCKSCTLGMWHTVLPWKSPQEPCPKRYPRKSREKGKSPRRKVEVSV